jgi:hypothetical protein
MRSSRELVGADDPQIGRVLFCRQDRRLPLPGEILEGVCVEQRLVDSLRWRSLMSESGRLATTFLTRRLSIDDVLAAP